MHPEFKSFSRVACVIFISKCINSPHVLNYISEQFTVLEEGKKLLKKLAIKCFAFGNLDVREALDHVEYIRDQFISHILSK